MDGKTKFNKVSRFFSEIPKKYLEKSEILSNRLVMNREENIKRENKYLEVNDCIYHPDWGEGTIVNKKETGNDCYITVYFKISGIKRLSLKYAPIKKIEKD